MVISSQTMYENGTLREVSGGTLHPGGFDITERMLALCNLPFHATILDLGCGNGSTVNFLLKAGYRAFGVDRSGFLLIDGIHNMPGLPLVCGRGISLPVASGVMDVAMAECSFSAMLGEEGLLKEVRRVLRSGGRLVISDVYVRDPDGISALRALPLDCGLTRAMTKEELFKKIQGNYFEITTWEDHSEVLKHLVAQMIFSYGSQNEFWSSAEPNADPLDIQIAIGKVKLGYFLLAATTK